MRTILWSVSSAARQQRMKSYRQAIVDIPRPDFIAVRGFRLEAGVRQDRPAAHRGHHIFFLQRRNAEALRKGGPQRQIRDARPREAHVEDRPGIVRGTFRTHIIRIRTFGICCAKGGAPSKIPVARMRSTEVEAAALVSAFSVS